MVSRATSPGSWQTHVPRRMSAAPRERRARLELCSARLEGILALLAELAPGLGNALGRRRLALTTPPRWGQTRAALERREVWRESDTERLRRGGRGLGGGL